MHVGICCRQAAANSGWFMPPHPLSAPTGPPGTNREGRLFAGGKRRTAEYADLRACFLRSRDATLFCHLEKGFGGAGEASAFVIDEAKFAITFLAVGL